MIYLGIVIAIVGLLFIIPYGKSKNDIIELLVMAFVNFIIINIFSTAFLFFIKQYSINRMLAIDGIVAIICFAFRIVLLKRNGEKIVFTNDIICKSYPSIIIIMLLSILFSRNFGCFGMGQDEGVYQTEAMYLYYGTNDWDLAIDEYKELEKSFYKYYYKDSVMDLLGYNLKYQASGYGFDESKMDDYKNSLEGVWHGLPTYPVFLALSMRIFGITGMLHCQTVFYILFLAVLELALLKLEISNISRIIMLMLIGVCPQIVWVKKSSLTEMLMSLLILTYVYFLIDKHDYMKKMSILPLGALYFYHISSFVFLPASWAIYILLLIRRKDRVYGVFALSDILLYFAGFKFMQVITPVYTVKNYVKSMGKYIGPFKLFTFIYLGLFFAIIFTLLLIYFYKKLNIADKYIYFVSTTLVVAIAVICVIKSFYAYESNISEFPNGMNSILALSMFSGVVLLPYLLWAILRGKYEINDENLPMVVLFIGVVLVYFGLLKVYIQYFYYYGRYLAPFLSVIIVTACALIKIQRKWILHILLFPAMILMFGFSLVLVKQNDDSIIDMQTYADCIHILDNDAQQKSDVVLLDTSLMRLFYFPLRSMGYKVYPIYKDVDTTLDNIDKQESDCYILSIEEGFDTNNNIIYANQTFREEDVMDSTDNIVHLVEKMFHEDYSVYLYYHNADSSLIESYSDDISGFAESVNQGPVWSLSEETEYTCYLSPQDYKIQLQFGDTIPFEYIHISEMTLDVYLNDEYLDTLILTEDNQAEAIFYLPEEYVKDGKNEITIIPSDFWSPSEFASNDTNNYGYSFKTMKILEVN